jgi:GxxExxY protein
MAGMALWRLRNPADSSFPFDIARVAGEQLFRRRRSPLSPNNLLISIQSMTNASEITEKIINAIIRVHQTLGAGFLERIYHNALIIELTRQGLHVESEKQIEVYYESELIGTHRLDLLIDNQVIVELKTVEELAGVHYAQLRSYLKAAKLRVGLLVNLAKDRADYRRVELEL